MKNATIELSVYIMRYQNVGTSKVATYGNIIKEKKIYKYKEEIGSNMDISNYTKQQGKFLKAEEVLKNPTALWEITDEGVFSQSDKFKNERLHIQVRNGEEVRTFDCSKTNASTIEKALKVTDTKKWIGHLLLLETYRTKTSDGKMTDAINIKEVR